MLKTFKLLFNLKNKDIRKRIGFTLLGLLIFAVGTTIPTPGTEGAISNLGLWQLYDVIGGGAKNDFLNQLVADVIQLPVVAGPSEATAVGNGLVQARAAGLVCDRWEMRRFILSSLSPQIFVPQKEFEMYKDAYQKFLSLTSK